MTIEHGVGAREELGCKWTEEQKAVTLANNLLAQTVIAVASGLTPSIHVTPSPRPREGNLKISIGNDEFHVELQGHCWVPDGREELSVTLSTVRFRRTSPWKMEIEWSHIPPPPFFDWAAEIIKSERDGEREAEIVAELTDHEPWRKEQEEQRRAWETVDKRPWK